MGFITIERHVFFIKPQEYDGGQNHLWVRNLRVGMGRESARSVVYMDDSMFGGLPHKVGGNDINKLRDFFMGKGYPFPKLIVANVRADELHTRTDMQKIMFERYKVAFRKTAGSTQGMPMINIWDREKDLKEAAMTKAQELAREKVGSREAGVIPSPLDMHRPHYQPEYFNQVWLLADPSKPGRVIVPPARAKALGRSVLDRNYKHVLYMDDRNGKRPVMDHDSVIILGVAYMLDYRQNQMPLDAVHLESIDSRVRTYMAPFINKHFGGDPEREDIVRKYYAMGLKALPPKSERWRDTPRGRIRKYRSYHKGVGIRPMRPGQENRILPLFVVSARNPDLAKIQAQNIINRGVGHPDPVKRERWLDIESAWHANGRQVLTVGALKLLKPETPVIP